MDYKIDFTTSAKALALATDPGDDFVLKVHGQIFAFPDADDQGGELVGELFAWRILAELVIDSGASLSSILSANGGSLAKVGETLKAAGLVEHVCMDMLVLEHVFLEPEHRGRDLALYATRALTRMHGTGCQIFILNGEPEVDDAALEEAARAKLEQHFARLGALKLPVEGTMFLDLTYQNRALDAAEFLPRGTQVRPFDLEAWPH